ncbi:MAG: hydroxyacid dehydrogenase [Rectinemataceae bacterium]|jgi:D-3-phosphoglycerate dehydrogenase
MNKVLIAQKVPEEALEILKKGVELVFSPSPDDLTVREYLRGCEGLLVRTATKLSAETIESAGSLKVISRTGVGYDNIDVAAATRAGIAVCATLNANTVSVAEHTVAMLLAIAKDLCRLDGEVRNGNWSVRDEGSAIDISGKTLGLIGLGKIGREVARLATVFGLKIIGFDAFLPENTKLEDIECMKGLDEVIGRADFVSIHVPLNPKTRHLIDERRLSLMKKTSFIVNTSRGGIIDEFALVAALDAGKIRGAALDVFENEPLPAGSPLCLRNDILLTPHSAALSRECKLRVALTAAEAILEYFNGEIPEGTVNREVFVNSGASRRQ